MSIPKPRYQNSAGRLLAILEIIQANQPVAQQIIPVIFGGNAPTDPKNTSIIGVKAITELHILYATFLEDLNNAQMGDDERSVLVKGLSSLETLMFPQALNQGMRAATDAEKALLEVCATRLTIENDLADTEIEVIRESIKTLKDSIDELPSDSVLRTVLLELTRLSEDSINRFNIYGAKGLKQAFKNMLAEVAEIYLQEEEAIVDIKDSSAWEKAVTHLKLFDSIAAKSMKYKPLLEKASQYLLGG